MPGKFPTMGLETEMFTIDENGKLVDRVDKIIRLLSGNRRVHAHMRKEVFKSMLEIGAQPGRKLREMEIKYLKNLESVLDLCEGEKTFLLPLGCYPAKSKSIMRRDPWYDMQSELYGRKRFMHALHICAFHFHYSLPRGIVEKSSRTIRALRYSKARDTFLNQYNFLVAADPALLTFCQSSPFHHGKHIAKDSRALLYRDIAMKKENKYGLYAGYPEFGGLPGYEATLYDLKELSSRRKKHFVSLLSARGIALPPRIDKISNLRFTWEAIRVNRLGTFEYRGPDMNYPSCLFSISYLIKLAFGLIKSQNLQMLPSDIGLMEPFKREGDTVYLPPFSRVKQLEMRSVLRGMESTQVRKYCSALFNFVVRNSKKKDLGRLEQISKMISAKKTLSDEIIGFVEKEGRSLDSVPDSTLRDVAIEYSGRLRKDVEKTIRTLSG